MPLFRRLPSNLPVEFGVFDKYVGVSIPDEHFTAHTSKTFRVVLLLSGNLLIHGDGAMKHKAQAKGFVLAFAR